MDALSLLKQAWPYLTALILAAWTLHLYFENKSKEAAKHESDLAAARAAADAAAAAATNDATKIAADIAAQTMRYQQEELKTARQQLAEGLKTELMLRRDIDNHNHEIEGLTRVNDQLRERIAFLEAEIKRQAAAFQLEIDTVRDRLSKRIEQLEGELREQKQIVESARRTAERGG